MNSRWIDIKAQDGGTFKAYLSLPPKGPKAGKGPGLVVIQEIWGVNDHIQAVADQYAMDGYTVIAPDVFWRLQPMVNLTYTPEDSQQAFAYMGKLDNPLAVKDIAAAVGVLRGMAECSGKVASLGFCMGGRLSFLSAANAGVDAAVCYYGGGIQDKLDEAPKIKCPILFHYAEKDAHIPMTAVDAVKKAFAGKQSASFHVYPGADHGFNCWGRPSYNQQNASLARGRSLEFLSANIS